MESGKGKIRFDLKQISAWDKQNENELKKKTEPKARPKSIFANDREKEEGDGTGFDHGYRDRASERRKEVDKDGTEMEEIAAKLDIEQSKFLGGKLSPYSIHHA